jgi:ABC-type sugar transport system ATPase subunit
VISEKILIVFGMGRPFLHMVKVILEDVSKSFGSSKVVNDLNLTVNDKEFVTLLGPSGCGKTTTLRCIAGLETVDSGKIMVDDQVVNDKSPQDRDVAMVFQNYALYPFMTVRDNITFPLRIHKVPKDKVERKLRDVSEMLHITHLLPRKPKQLSGGEQQRVAVGRALVRDPKLFLLDEPFSNLDAKLRIETRSEIKSLQKELGITTIFVTHDQAEAMALADRIAVMNQGSLQQIGTPDETYGKPANVMVAQFLGSPAMNVLNARFVKPDTIMIKDGVDVAVRRPEASKLASLSGVDEIRVGFRPEDAEFEIGGQDGIPAEVRVEEPSGTHMLLTLEVSASLDQVKVVMPPGFAPKLGTKGRIRVKKGKLNIFDTKSGDRVE